MLWLLGLLFVFYHVKFDEIIIHTPLERTKDRITLVLTNNLFVQVSLYLFSLNKILSSNLMNKKIIIKKILPL